MFPYEKKLQKKITKKKNFQRKKNFHGKDPHENFCLLQYFLMFQKLELEIFLILKMNS